jgi:hypothetical protein
MKDMRYLKIQYPEKTLPKRKPKNPCSFKLLIVLSRFTYGSKTEQLNRRWPIDDLSSWAWNQDNVNRERISIRYLRLVKQFLFIITVLYNTFCCCIEWFESIGNDSLRYIFIDWFSCISELERRHFYWISHEFQIEQNKMFNINNTIKGDS